MTTRDRLEALARWHADNERNYQVGTVDPGEFIRVRSWLRDKMDALRAGNDD